MARKIELRTGVLTAKGPNGAPVTFAWGETMSDVLRRAPGEGVALDQILRVMKALEPVTRAIEDKADCVTLTEEQWRTLCERLEVFRFGIADPAIAEFGLAIRNAPEIT
ncbi:MAG TPA: hypothetical protein VGF39_03880 [Stellaceae bacterium]|jgi:hypothetical protein